MKLPPKKLLNQRQALAVMRRFLARQNEKCSTSEGECLYRHLNSDGKSLKCAVGALIPDSLYSECLEGFGPHDETIWDVLKFVLEDSEDMVHMLGQIQAIHDENDPSEWDAIITHHLATNSYFRAARPK